MSVSNSNIGKEDKVTHARKYIHSHVHTNLMQYY